MQCRRASVLLASSLLVAIPAAQGRRLSGPMPPAVAGDVLSTLSSPDGSRVVFLADAEVDDRFDLYSAPTAGGAPVRLNPTPAPGGEVTADFLVTSDSARVVYRADQDADEVFELYSVPIAGGAVTKLSGALAPGVDVAGAGPRISASTGRVVYRTMGGGGPDLFSVPSDGSAAPVQLNAGASFEQVQQDFAISHDGLGVAYRSDATVDGRFDLWVVTIDGGIPPQLRSSGPGVSDVLDFAFAPLDARLVYRADHAVTSNLYSVPVVGGAPTRLDPVLAGGYVDQFAIAPDGARVVYTAFHDADQLGGIYCVAVGGGASTELNPRAGAFAIGNVAPYPVAFLDDRSGLPGRLELHLVALEGGVPTQISLGSADVQEGFVFSPDGAYVVHLAHDLVPPGGNLFASPVAGGTPAQLNAVRLDDTTLVDFEVAPDSASVLFLDDQDQPGVREAWIAPIAGGAAIRPHPALPSTGNVLSAHLDPTGQRVVYRADQEVDNAVDVYSVETSGGAPAELGPPLATLGTEGDVLDFRLRADGGRVVYLADQAVDEVHELFVLGTSGGAPVRLNAPLGADRDVTAFEVSPDWSRAVYRADHDGNDAFRLYGVPLDGGAPVALDAGPVAGGDVEDFVVSPDSTRVVYRADQEIDGKFELYGAPIAGGAAVKLNPVLGAEGDVSAGLFRVSPDSSRVVFVASQAPGRHELWSVPMAGGVAVRLNDPLDPNDGDVDVTGFEISADSSRVVYTGDQDFDSLFELWSVPLAGGAVTQLNPQLTLGGDVTSYRLAPDSSRVVYRADQDQNEVYELYSVPLAGGTALQLNAALAAGGDVQAGDGDYAISADSSWVLYLADQDADEVIELFSVPLGGGTPVRLNAPLPAGGDVWSFELAPDCARAVYCADQDENDVQELYGVELATGTITRLHPPLQDGASALGRYVLTPDSRSVVLVAPLLVTAAVQIFALPLTGEGPRSLTGRLPGLDVALFEVRGGRVVYTANQEASSVYELFAATLPRGMRQGSVPP